MPVYDRVRTSRSPINPDTLRNQIEGMMLFKKLLPEALKLEQAEVRSGGIGGPNLPYLRLDRVKGVYIYQSIDGWYADISFRDMPPGVPDTMGTPAANPLRTRAEAERAAIGLIGMVIAVEKKNKEHPIEDNSRKFSLDHVIFSFDRKMVDAIYEVLPSFNAMFGGTAEEANTELCEVRLLSMLNEDFKDVVFTGEGFDALPEERKKIYYIWMTASLALGMFRLWRKDYPIETYDERLRTVATEIDELADPWEEAAKQGMDSRKR